MVVTLYFDASAMVKLYLDEPMAHETRELARAARELSSSIVAKAETVSAFRRAVRSNRIGEQLAARLRDQFESEWSRYATVTVNGEIAELGAALAWRYTLRGFDAIHLASAVFLQSFLRRPLTFATFDAALSRAAQDEGFEAWP